MSREAAKRRARWSVALALGLAVAAAGCGSSSQATLSSTPPSTATTASGGHPVHFPDISMVLTTPAIPHGGGPIAARYTCDGSDVAPAIHWTAVPAGTREIVVFVLNYAYVHGKPVVDWAVAGLNPELRSISSGALPHGAVVGRNSLGHSAYSLCPSRGPKETYAVVLLALPHKLKAKKGFNAVALHALAEHSASREGLLSFTYQRA
jgi:phosphatidylethanolamine-binding protein (PEBP) family uncharacterized protein